MQLVLRFAQRIGRPLSELSVLVAGLAFKGLPETNDLRGSSGVDVCRELAHHGCKVLGFDAVVDATAIEGLCIEPVNLYDGADQCDVLLILNNHPDNLPEGLIARLRGRKTLVFDGWSLLDRHEVEQYDGIIYATMGYMTPENGSSA